MDFTLVVALTSFGLIGAALLAVAVYWLFKGFARLRARRQDRRRQVAAGAAGDRAEIDQSERAEHNPVSWLAGLILLRSRRNQKRPRRPRNDFDDELPREVMALLAATSAASVIVDSEGKVLRSSPSTYRLGIVNNDSVVEPQVAQALATVFAKGGQQRFNLMTMTAPEYVDTAITDGDSFDDEAAWLAADSPADSQGNKAAAHIGTVSRRNWLKVSVARLNQSQAVVLIDDISAQERFNRVREAFVSNVTEQLLKPTHALEELGRELDSGHIDQASLAHYAGQVSAYSADLNHLVSDLLFLLRAQQPEPGAASRVEVKPLVERVVARHLVTAREHGVSLHSQVAAGLAVTGQVDQVEGALAKLVENAIDYSPAGSGVSLAAGLSADGKGVVIRVVDHGQGIPVQDQPHIFERFWRGQDQGGRTSQGTGLGLAIVKHVALTHRGSVSVWSAPGQGSTFSLTLPAAGPVAQASAVAHTPAATQTSTVAQAAS